MSMAAEIWSFSRLVPNTIRRILMGERPVVRSPEEGEYKRDFLYIKDQVRAYMALSEGLKCRSGAGKSTISAWVRA